MGENVFCSFQHLKRGKYGQTMVFLLVVLVILVAASVSLVHIGRIGVRKVRTANAADAAALAAASSLASVAMNIYDMNRILRQEYLAFVLYLEASALLKGSCKRKWCDDMACPQFITDFAIYVLYIINAQWVDYLMLIWTAKQGFKSARGSGHAMAFANVGIDEAVMRNKSAGGDIIPSRLSMWLNGHPVSDPQPSPPVIPNGEMDKENSYTFRWRSYSADPISGKEIQEDKPNEVTSYVKFTDCAFELEPKLLPPPIKKYTFTYAGWSNRYLCPCTWWCCSAGCCCGVPCCIYDDGETDLSCNMQDIQGWQKFMEDVETYSKWATGLFMIAEFLPQIFDWLSSGEDDDCPAKLNINQIIYALVALLVGPIGVISQHPPLVWPLSYLNPGIECACSASNWAMCPRHCPAQWPACATIYFFVPVPWIENIDNMKNCDDSKVIKVKTQVTFTEPSKDMGFWKRKRTVVTSSATAKICKKGTFETFTPGGYEVMAELTEAK